MKILFLTIGRLGTIDKPGIYSDLLRELVSMGHEVYSVSQLEWRMGLDTQYEESGSYHALSVRTGNITKCNLIEKGISTVLLQEQFLSAIKKHIRGVAFDLVLYSTPPITFGKVVQYIKKRDSARTYLLLKDIFPQNAVDLGMMKKTGIKGLLYKYFRAKEKKLYAISDRIGCMSQANVDYVLKNNPQLDPQKVEICPNSVEFKDMRVDEKTRNAMREKYGIPQDKKIFLYGGNLGKPQGMDHLIACMRTQKEYDDRFFLVIGSGTEFGKLQQFAQEGQKNFKLMAGLPKEDYDRMVAACDVGLIFLDHRFTIPNFPSRLLSYMQAGLPVLCCTDPNTDIGKVCVEGGFGWWCESNNPASFGELVKKALHSDLSAMGEQGAAYLRTHYAVAHSCQLILSAIQNEK